MSLTFDVVAIWPDEYRLPILTGVPRAPYTHPTTATSSWVKNTTLWILGGLVATTEAALILSQESLVVKVSVDSNKDGPSLEGNIPADVAVVFIHIPLGLKKPGLVSTDWNQGREKGEGEVTAINKTRVCERSQWRCILTNEPARGVKKTSRTHQVAHIIAKHCSSKAVAAFAEAVQVLTPFPQLESVGEPPNLGYLMVHIHGPFDSNKFGVYIPSYLNSLDPVTSFGLQTGTLTATLEIHQVQERDDFEPGKHSLRDAVIAANAARAVSPPAPGQIGSLVTMHTALDCKDPTLDDGYPHPILWRVHYATLCVSNWGSAELKALIYGLLRDEEEDEDEDDEDEDEDDEDDDDEEEDEDEVHQMKRGKMCEFILHNFVVNSPATIA